jgi:hypothetical protein
MSIKAFKQEGSQAFLCRRTHKFSSLNNNSWSSAYGFMSMHNVSVQSDFVGGEICVGAK